MQGINYFLVGTAFVVAGYGATFQSKNYVVAAAVAALGAGVALAFWMLDARTRQLVKAAEVPIRQIERSMAARAGIDSLRLVDAVEKPAPATSSYRGVMRVLCTMVALWMLVALVVAIGYGITQ
jgi:hypothetical protein